VTKYHCPIHQFDTWVLLLTEEDSIHCVGQELELPEYDASAIGYVFACGLCITACQLHVNAYDDSYLAGGCVLGNKTEEGNHGKAAVLISLSCMRPVIESLSTFEAIEHCRSL